ncbi:MAG TPA: NAD(P)-dependent oxidoreductase [Burkholderiales bacterium]|nr:NAD(P)-dependent oxidoreductase [Burkholderiales bacterium]
MRKIVFGPVIAPAAWAIGESLLPEGFSIEILSKDEKKRAEQWKDAEFYMGFRGGLMEADYERMGKLKLMQFLSAGYDGVQLDTLRELGISLANNGGANSYAVAEHAILLMLAVSRQLPDLDRLVKSGKWKSNRFGEEEEHEIAGKTIGIIGLGFIGKTLARRLAGFEVKLLYADPVRPTPEDEAKLNVRHVDHDTLFRESDIVTLHAPFDATTHHMVNERTLGLMKKDAILINCARGELVDEAALYSALKGGKIWAAGLDTYDPEPPKPDNPLFTLPNVVLTPHAAGPTWESWPKRFGNSYANVQRVARGEAPLWVVPELRK